MIVLDHTAILALRRGHEQLTAWASVSPEDDGDRLHVPVGCLLAAAQEPEAPELADAIGGFIGVDFVALDYLAYCAVEALTQGGLPWPYGHAVHTIRSVSTDATAETQCLIISATPEAYKGQGVLVADIQQL